MLNNAELEVLKFDDKRNIDDYSIEVPAMKGDSGSVIEPIELCRVLARGSNMYGRVEELHDEFKRRWEEGKVRLSAIIDFEEKIKKRAFVSVLKDKNVDDCFKKNKETTINYAESVYNSKRLSVIKKEKAKQMQYNIKMRYLADRCSSKLREIENAQNTCIQQLSYTKADMKLFGATPQHT